MAHSKAYEQLDYTDYFVFGKVNEDLELCRDTLSCLLQREVGKLSEPVIEKNLQFIIDGKPVRLDIYTQDDDCIYNAEMQNLNHHSVESLALPQRSRFYQSSIDMDFVNRKQTYCGLPDARIIFICTFDPFGLGDYRYTFLPNCTEHTELFLNDGTARIFFNTSYNGNDIPEDLKNLFNYISTGKVSDELTDRINKAVVKVRNNNIWRSEYMKEWDLLMRERRDGIQEGIGQGLLRANKLTFLLLKLNRMDDVVRSVSDPAYQEQLFKEFGL